MYRAERPAVHSVNAFLHSNASGNLERRYWNAVNDSLAQILPVHGSRHVPRCGYFQGYYGHLTFYGESGDNVEARPRKAFMLP